MTELGPDEAADDANVPTGGSGGGLPGRGPTRAPLMLAALGVVYGDIGTSPLYAMRAAFGAEGGGLQPTRSDVYGLVSLIFWSVTLIVSVKYVTFMLRADNDGEGGIMALAALARRAVPERSTRRTSIVVALGVLGASLFYGDSAITPAISVLSAVEGLKTVSPDLSEVVVPAAVVVLAALFAVQRWGTGRVGRFFGPIMLLWFAVSDLRK